MSVYVSQRFESESIRNLPIRARKFLLLPTEEEGLREDKKNASFSLSDFDAKTMRAKESTRTGRVQSTTNDWTFLDPFFAAGAIFMFDFFLSVWWDFARKTWCLCWWCAKREKSVFLFFCFIFLIFRVHSSLLLLWSLLWSRRQQQEDDFQLGRIDGVLPVRVLVPGAF